MRKAMKIAALILCALFLIPLISLLVSPPWGGEDIARSKGLIYRMAVAHRGASYLAPENTTAAFELARDIGADYLETDVQRTRDGKLILVHDETFERTTDVAEVFPGREKDPVGSFTLGEVLRLDAGSWFNKKNPDRAQRRYAGLRIPVFMQYLLIARAGENRPGVLIELKKPEKYPGIEAQVVAELRQAGWLDGNSRVRTDSEKGKDTGRVVAGYGENAVILQSFGAESLAILQKIAPAVRRNYLVDEDKEREKGGFGPLLDTALKLQAEIGPSGYMGWPWYVAAAHRERRYFFVYTIDKGWHFTLFTFFGVDGVITNRVDRFLEYQGRPLSARPAELLKRFR